MGKEKNELEKVKDEFTKLRRQGKGEMSEDEIIDKSKLMDIKLFAAVMDGDNIHNHAAPKQGVLLMGNEAKGLSNKLIESASERISIPGGGAAESLNVGVATGILVDWALRGSAND